jgi:hypothetical protein
LLIGGGVKITKNLIIRGLTMFCMLAITSIKAQNTFTVSELQADSATITIKLEATKVQAQTTEANYAKADSVSAGIVRTDTLCSAKDLCVHQDAKVSGNLTVGGSITTNQGLLFNSTTGLKYIPASSTSPPYIVLGNIGIPSPTVIPNICVPVSSGTPILYVGGGHLQIHYQNTLLELMADGANSLIESKGNGGLLLNYYCGKDIAVGSPTAGGNLITNNDAYVYGKLGVGTNTPTEKVDVSGTIRAVAGKFGWNNKYIELSYDGSNHRMETSQSLLINYTSGKDVVVGSLNNGDFTANNNAWIKKKLYVGDKRVKSTNWHQNAIVQVAGKIACYELVVLDPVTKWEWPDYVFDKNYSLPKLSDVEKYIYSHHHLPDVPTAKEIKETGLNVYEMNVILLKKLEESMLYIIELNKKIEALEKIFKH